MSAVHRQWAGSLEAPELRNAKETTRTHYARTANGLVIGASWMPPRSPESATCVSGPHRNPTSFADKVIYRVMLPLGAVVVLALVLAERFA